MIFVKEKGKRPWEGTVESSEKSTQISSQISSQKSSQKILQLVLEDSKITTSKMAEIIGISRRAIAKQIESLKQKGKIKRIGPDKGGYWEVIDKE